jgi:hypothetical protein
MYFYFRNCGAAFAKWHSLPDAVFMYILFFPSYFFIHLIIIIKLLSLLLLLFDVFPIVFFYLHASFLPLELVDV